MRNDLEVLRGPRAGIPALLLAAAFSLLAMPGCQSTSVDPYVSPRVVGRVLDAQTRQPLADVRVRKVSPDQNVDPSDPPHGGETIEQAPSVRTGPDGTFVLDSVRDITPFNRSGWYSVTISFDHARYQRLTKDYTLANSTNLPSGEPLVKTGDIFLAPKPQ